MSKSSETRTTRTKRSQTEQSKAKQSHEGPKLAKSSPMVSNGAKQSQMVKNVPKEGQPGSNRVKLGQLMLKRVKFCQTESNSAKHPSLILYPLSIVPYPNFFSHILYHISKQAKWGHSLFHNSNVHNSNVHNSMLTTQCSQLDVSNSMFTLHVHITHAHNYG